MAKTRNGAVALYDREPRPSALGGFPAIPLFRNRQEITLSREFDIPRAEYEHWRIGGQPNLVFLSKDHTGIRMRSIQLSRAFEKPRPE
jgi:hypothetical protein